MLRSIEDVIRDGDFRYVYNPYQTTLAHLWNPGMGTEVRGDFVLITMRLPYYTENEVNLYMWRLGGGRLKAATAYELAVFATPGKGSRWNGRHTVMALGSKAGRGAVPLLECVGRHLRRLTMEGPDESRMWRNNRSILCVEVRN